MSDIELVTLRNILLNFPQDNIGGFEGEIIDGGETDEDLERAIGLSLLRYEEEKKATSLKITNKEINNVLGKYEKIKGNDKILENECIICSENFKINEMKRKLPCSHIFHKKCIDKWFTKYKCRLECVLCKEDFSNLLVKK